MLQCLKTEGAQVIQTWGLDSILLALAGDLFPILHMALCKGFLF